MGGWAGESNPFMKFHTERPKEKSQNAFSTFSRSLLISVSVCVCARACVYVCFLIAAGREREDGGRNKQRSCDSVPKYQTLCRVLICKPLPMPPCLFPDSEGGKSCAKCIQSYTRRVRGGCVYHCKRSQESSLA